MSHGEAAFAAAASAAVVTIAASRLLMRNARHLGLVDPPGARKPQRRAVPLVGGALFAAIVLGGLVGSRLGGVAIHGAELLALAAPLLCFAVGMVDDARRDGLAPGTKALATLFALLPAIHVGARELGGIVAPESLLLATLAFVALHASNTIDHAHGLCGMVAAIGASTVAWSASRDGPVAAGILAAVVAGSAAGFLGLNFPRGRVFLGDGGSLLLGGCLAMALLASRRVEWLLLAAVPLADLLSVALLRLRLGVRPWVGDRRHVTHRLMARGVAEPIAVLLLALIQAACSLLAAGRLFAEPHLGAPLLVAGVIAALAFCMLLVPLPRASA